MALLLQGSAICSRPLEARSTGLEVRVRRRIALLQHVPFSVSRGAALSRSTVRRTWTGEDSESVGISKCFASGGSRRDWQKLTARTKKRRARHMKGVTPTHQDLLDELGREVESDEILGAEDYTDDDEGIDNEDEDSLEGVNGVEGKGIVEQEQQLASPVPLSRNGGSFHDYVYDNRKANHFNGKNSGAAEEASENSKQGITAPESANRSSPDRGNISQDHSERVATGQANEVATSAGKVVEIGQGTVDEVGKQVVRAGEAVGQDLSNVGAEVGSTVSKVAEVGQATAKVVANQVLGAGEAAGKGLADAGADLGKTTGKVVEKAQDKAQESGKQLDESSRVVEKKSSTTGGEGESFIREGQDSVRAQLQQDGGQASQSTQTVLDRLDNKARVAAQNVQESSSNALNETAKAAEVLGSELRGIGEIQVQATGDAVGLPGLYSTLSGRDKDDHSDEESEPSKNGSAVSNGKTATEEESTEQSSLGRREPEQPELEETGKALRVFVAGDSGRLSRLIVDELLNKGANVSTLAPTNSNTSRYLRKLESVKVVEDSSYRYEAVRKVLAESDAVICALGNEVYPFDPLKMYRAYEGVLNLVAAAKNKGNIKKFILVTSLGVTRLQVIPSLFWRKQAELFLQRSGLDYVIIRPGLTAGSGSKWDRIELHPEDSQLVGFVSQRKVAEVCVAALSSDVSQRVVEVVGGNGRSASSDVAQLLDTF